MAAHICVSVGHVPGVWGQLVTCITSVDPTYLSMILHASSKSVLSPNFPPVPEGEVGFGESLAPPTFVGPV